MPTQILRDVHCIQLYLYLHAVIIVLLCLMITTAGKNTNTCIIRVGIEYCRAEVILDTCW